MFKENHQDEDFKKKREEYAVDLRRNTREEIFSKKRNINNVSEFNEYIVEQKKGTKLLIVDQNFRNEIESFIKKEYTVNMFEELVNCISDIDIIKQHYGVIGIRKIISIENSPPIQEVIDVGLVPRLIEYMKQNKYPQLQLQATWALTNVASGTTIQTQSIIDKGGIPLFIKIVSQNNPGIAEQAIWALGNIAGDCAFFRDIILRNGGLDPLLKIIQTSTDKVMLRQACWAVSNLCRGNPLPKYEQVKASIPVLCKALNNQVIDDREVLSDCCWAISYFTEGQKSRIQRVVECQVVPTIVKLVQTSSQYGIIVPCIRVLGNIVTGNQLQTDCVLKAGALDVLESHLTHNKKTIRRQTCWVISNIAAGTMSQVNEIVVRQRLISKLLQMFESDSAEVKKQICWIFANMSHLGEPSSILNLYKQHSIIRYYINLLVNEDQKIIETSLQCLFTVLSVGQKSKYEDKNILILDLYNLGAIDVIQKLQYHQSQSVYNKVVKLLQRYFQIADPLDL